MRVLLKLAFVFFFFDENFKDDDENECVCFCDVLYSYKFIKRTKKHLSLSLSKYRGKKRLYYFYPCAALAASSAACAAPCTSRASVHDEYHGTLFSLQGAKPRARKSCWALQILYVGLQQAMSWRDANRIIPVSSIGRTIESVQLLIAGEVARRVKCDLPTYGQERASAPNGVSDGGGWTR